MHLESTTVLRTVNDVIRLSFPGADGSIFVLQLGDADQNIVVRQGGELVFELLELCDGHRSFGEVTESLQVKFDGSDALWSAGLSDAVRALLSWRVVEVVSQ